MIRLTANDLTIDLKGEIAEAIIDTASAQARITGHFEYSIDFLYDLAFEVGSRKLLKFLDQVLAPDLAPGFIKVEVL